MRIALVTIAAALTAACSSGGGDYGTMGSGAGNGPTGSGSGNGSSTSSGGSGTTSGSSFLGCADGGDAGHEPSATDLQPCTSDAGCSCLEVCVEDAAAGQKLCELPCRTQADCIDPDAPQVACRNGYCGLNVCGQGFAGTAPGSFGASCDVADAGDGTCQPEQVLNAGSTVLIGYCLPNGSLGLGAQDCANDELGADLQCAAGLICPYQFGDYGCSPGCPTPGGSGTCASGETCLALFPDETNAGVCGSCLPAGDYCLADTDCCHGPCVADAGFSSCFVSGGVGPTDGGVDAGL